MAQCVLHLVTTTFPKSHLSQIQAPPTLAPSLVKDYIHFVTTFFKVISTSATHIYHTALPLSPQTSTVRQLYKKHAHPFARVVRDQGDSLPAFSTDGMLAAVFQPKENKVVVLGLGSGDPLLVMDVDVGTSSLRVIGTMVALTGSGMVSVWGIVPGVSGLIADKLYAHPFKDSWPASNPGQLSTFISISPTLEYIAIVKECTTKKSYHLNIYDLRTETYLTQTATDPSSVPCFTPDGGAVWCVDVFGRVAGWAIVKEHKSNRIELSPLELSGCPQGVFPWISSCGYEISNDGWVLSPTREQLLWLPPHWRPLERQRVWQGRFFGFLHSNPPELVILEFLK